METVTVTIDSKWVKRINFLLSVNRANTIGYFNYLCATIFILVSGMGWEGALKWSVINMLWS
jgi:hypothetical protein